MNVTIGRYYHSRSLVHRLDPRTKMLSLASLIISVFLAGRLWGFLIIASFTVAAILLSRLPFRLVLRSLRPMTWLFVSIMILQVLFPDGHSGPIFPRWSAGMLLNGIYGGIMVGCRFLLIFLGAVVLTSTTMPLRLADGMAQTLRPLRRLGLPVHELPIMMVIILHFIPTLLTEAQKLMSAQKARGAQLGSRNILKKLRALMPILVPLLRGSFRRADELAMGMESRCYHGGDRTHLYELKFTKSDGIALGASTVMIPLAMVVDAVV